MNRRSRSVSAALFIVAVGAFAACGDDDGPVVNEPCPDGQGTFEVQASGLPDLSPLFEVQGTEVASPTNTALSAPNGRLVMCVSKDGDAVVVMTGTDLLTTRVTASPRILGDGLPPITAPVATASAADAIASGLGVGRTGTTLFVAFYDDNGDALTGAELAVPGSDGPFARNAGGTFESVTAVGDDPFLLFLNVPGTVAALNPDVPGGYDCDGAGNAELEPGNLAFVPHRCRM